jgi:hypothetical protein
MPEPHQELDALHGKTEVTRPADETQGLYLSGAVDAVSAVLTVSRRYQANAFVVSEHFGADTGCSGSLSYDHSVPPVP